MACAVLFFLKKKGKYTKSHHGVQWLCEVTLINNAERNSGIPFSNGFIFASELREKDNNEELTFSY